MQTPLTTLSDAATGVAELVGRTPLVRLAAFEPRGDVEIHAKLESRNPGGSIKDRAALAIILDAERAGALRPGLTLLDATSGNTGIAYAMLAGARGYRVRLCVPENVTLERKRLLLAYGADLVFTDPMDGTDGAIVEARRLHAENPDAYFYADQYNNPANPRAHYETTGPEILEQTRGRVTHFVAGLGTSGTFMGVARRLREHRPGITLISVQPDSPLHALEGLKHMPTAITPGIYDPGVADENRTVTTEAAHELVHRLAREAGLLVGPSSGAALAAAVQIAREIDRGVIVTIFPDGGDRYLNEPLWQPPALARLTVTADVDKAIRRHAAETYPDECCGALLGQTGVALEALPLGNIATGERARRFLVSPDDYRRAETRADEIGLALVGFYHSHPDHPAVPSAVDLEQAWPNLSYPIVSVRDGRPTELRSWRLRADRSEFLEERIHIQTSRSLTCP